MPHRLEVPDSFSRLSIQGDQTICEQVVAYAIGAIEIGRGRACRNVDDSTLTIKRHAGPVVSGTARLPGIFRPGVVAEFSRVRNSVKRPAQLAGANVVSADVPGRGR